MFDLGTGLRTLGDDVAAARATCADSEPFQASVLLSHLHWDHIQGLPFLAQLSETDACVDVYGPRQSAGSLAEVFAGVMRPPYFPITPDELNGRVEFCDVGADYFPIGDAKVCSKWIRHTDPTLGFRVELDGVSIAYIADHGPGCDEEHRDDWVPDEVLELADGVDLLIHDSQHTCDEFETKRHHGHSTVDYAVQVARVAGARRLALFHHCPSHSDRDVDLILEHARELSAQIEGPKIVVAAYEGLCLDLAMGR